jgi:hypothetical protein
MKYIRLSFLLCGLTFLIASCQKELSYEAGLGKGTLKKDVTGECLPVNINGSYQKDTLLKPIVNFVDVQVSASEVGSYSIKTDTINGYSFSGAGVFAVQGLNTVRLIGAGTPIAAGFDMFTVKFDTSVCQFNVTVIGSGGGGSISADSIVATIDGAFTTFKIRDSSKLDNTRLPGYSAVGIFGDNNMTGDESFGLVIAKMGVSVTPGIYTINQAPAVVLSANYRTLANNYSAVSDTTTQTPGFTITISSITGTKVVGTFSGRLKDNGGSGTGFKTVTNGIFSVKIYP